MKISFLDNVLRIYALPKLDTNVFLSTTGHKYLAPRYVISLTPHLLENLSIVPVLTSFDCAAELYFDVRL